MSFTQFSLRYVKPCPVSIISSEKTVRELTDSALLLNLYSNVLLKTFSNIILTSEQFE